jgi:hypothetical protein
LISPQLQQALAHLAESEDAANGAHGLNCLLIAAVNALVSIAASLERLYPPCIHDASPRADECENCGEMPSW